MKREDLRSKIVPTTIENTEEFQKTENEKFNTTDLIYLDSYNEQLGKTELERMISDTDYAIMNNRFRSSSTGEVWLRSASNKFLVHWVNGNGELSLMDTSTRLGVCPSLRYQLPSESKEIEQLDIREAKDRRGIIYHVLRIGEYGKVGVDEDLSRTLESLYHEGKIQEGVLCTGRWYSSNGQKRVGEGYVGKHNPEFEYQGKRYVRVVSEKFDLGGDRRTIKWGKIEPISFVIKNWDEMPKSINPRGNGRAKYFDLRAEEAIISSIPFYPYTEDENGTMWQNSTVRGFLNGIDVRNIQSNGNIEYGANRGGNFTGECNFLNEAFNLSREPMIEYTIPDSETEIPDDAFNGCITLKKIVIHSGITSIGKRAFNGLQFKYLYRTEIGELVFAQELPRNENEYTDMVEIGKIVKSFDGFDYIKACYEMISSGEIKDFDPFDCIDYYKTMNSGEINDLVEILSKNKFSIPLALIKSGNTRAFTENSNFRFFKNEIPQINDMLLDFPEEERLDFFKFASSLGCFSAKKILDKRGKETQVPLAQKASSLLAKLLKTDKMKLR